jgi:uncharacterized phage-like protein YoqJ
MIVTFCGHSSFFPKEKHRIDMLKILEEQVGNNRADLFLGGYGGFDSFAYSCAREYKKTHPGVSIVFVTPYLNDNYIKKYIKSGRYEYDHILYPDIENKPLRLAILYRNRYMVEKADVVIAYVNRKGGAYQMHQYAKRKSKEIFNLAEKDI